MDVDAGLRTPMRPNPNIRFRGDTRSRLDGLREELAARGSRPGRNATGFSDILADLSGKFVELAIELTKPQTTIDYLWHTPWPDGQNRYRATEHAVQAAGMQLRAKGIADIAELDVSLCAFVR